MVNEKTKARPVWDKDIEKLEYSGSQFLGTQGKLFMKTGKVFDFTIDTVREQEYFSYSVKLPGASTKWYFELKDSNPSTQLRMGVEISGFMGWMYNFMLSSTLDKAFEDCTQNLIKMS